MRESENTVPHLDITHPAPALSLPVLEQPAVTGPAGGAPRGGAGAVDVHWIRPQAARTAGLEQ